MKLFKWQILAGETMIGETDAFEFADVNRDDITHQRWSLMSKAREMFPEREFPGYEYRLVKVEQNDTTL